MFQHRKKAKLFLGETNQIDLNNWNEPRVSLQSDKFDILANCVQTLVWTEDICLITKMIFFSEYFAKILLEDSCGTRQMINASRFGVYRTWCVLCINVSSVSNTFNVWIAAMFSRYCETIKIKYTHKTRIIYTHTHTKSLKPIRKHVVVVENIQFREIAGANKLLKPM